MAKKIDYAQMFTLRKDGRYQTSYIDHSGKRRYVYHRDPKALYEKLQALENPENRIVTFGMVAELWEREHREQIEVRTWRNYEPHFRQLLDMYGNRPFEEMSALDAVNDLARAKAVGYSATVVRTRRSLFNMIFDFAVVNGYAKYNPIGSVKLPKGLKKGKRTAPTQEQMVTILTRLDAPFGLFPFLLLCTGLRKSEALALQWSDVDFENRQISVTKSLDTTDGANPKYKSPKTEAGNRTVPIIEVLYQPLMDAQKESKSELVFPCPPSNRGGKGGDIITDRAYDGLWLRYCQAVGFIENGKPTVTAHQLRHGTATLMFENDVDSKTAQAVLGHSREEVTREIYTDLRMQQKVKSLAKLNAGLSQMMSESKKPL